MTKLKLKVAFLNLPINQFFINFFISFFIIYIYIYIHIYIKLFKILSAKYNQENKEGLQKTL